MYQKICELLIIITIIFLRKIRPKSGSNWIPAILWSVFLNLLIENKLKESQSVSNIVSIGRNKTGQVWVLYQPVCLELQLFTSVLISMRIM